MRKMKRKVNKIRFHQVNDCKKAKIQERTILLKYRSKNNFVRNYFDL